MSDLVLIDQQTYATQIQPKIQVLIACVTECSHMTSKEEIWIDNVLVDTVYECGL